MDKVYYPNDKTNVRLEETGNDSQAHFLSQLSSSELDSLQRLKAFDPVECEGKLDSFLMKFLWSRKLIPERASQLLNSHREWRKEWKFDELDVDAIRSYLYSGISYWIPGLYTKRGLSASFIMLRNLDLSKWKYIGARGLLHGAYYITDMASDHDIDIGRRGTIIFYDFTDASWADIISVVRGQSDIEINKVLVSAQDHMPSRVREIILYNPPFGIRLVLALVKPFLKENLKDKIRCMKKSEILDYFDEDNLPTFFGGKREFNIKPWTDQVLAARPYLSEGKFIDLTPRLEIPNPSPLPTAHKD